MKPDTIVLVLVHGFRVTPRSWEHWITRYQSHGFRVPAPAYPGFEVEVEALNADDHHGDNLDDAGRALLAGVTAVVTTRAGARRLGGTTLRGLKAGQTTQLQAPDRPPVDVTATPADMARPSAAPSPGRSSDSPSPGPTSTTDHCGSPETRFCTAPYQRRFGVKRLCDILGIARSSFYYWHRIAPPRPVRPVRPPTTAWRPGYARSTRNLTVPTVPRGSPPSYVTRAGR